MMDVILNLVLWLHLLALTLGGAASFGIPAVGALMAKSEPAQRPVYGGVMMKLSALGRMALVLLVLTGAILLFGRYGGGSGLGGLFWLKIVLVVLMIGLVIFNLQNGNKARAGDAAAIARAPLLGKIGMGLLSGIVLLAVLAFN